MHILKAILHLRGTGPELSRTGGRLSARASKRGAQRRSGAAHAQTKRSSAFEMAEQSRSQPVRAGSLQKRLSAGRARDRSGPARTSLHRVRAVLHVRGTGPEQSRTGGRLSSVHKRLSTGKARGQSGPERTSLYRVRAVLHLRGTGQEQSRTGGRCVSVCQARDQSGPARTRCTE
jgi:hypothetical protein